MMRKCATIFLLLFLVGSYGLSQAKPGGIAREISMGGSNLGLGVVMNPYIVDDPSRLLFNPADQAHYRNYVWWNVGGGTLNGVSTADNGYGKQNMGVSFGIGSNFTLGAILSYDPSAMAQVAGVLQGQPSMTIGGVTIPAIPSYIPNVNRGAGVTGPQAIPNLGNVFEVLAAYDAGRMNLGFGVMYGDASNTSTDNPAPNQSTETEASARMFGFTAGLDLDLGAGSSFAAAAGLRLDKATDKVTINPPVTGQGGEFSSSGTEISVDARLRLRLSNRVNFVPYVGFLNVSAEPSQDSPVTGGADRTDSRTFTMMALGAGAGAEYHVPSFYLAGGVSFQTLSLKTEFSQSTPQSSTTTTYSYTAVPVFNIGAEWWFTEWLAGRAGYYRSPGSVKVKGEFSSGGTSSSSESTQPLPNSAIFIGGISPSNFDGLVTLGLGFKFGGFALDATVSEEALRRGFGLIGSQDNLNSFGFITTSYSFD
jgi:opacity protein-like surface antigen